MDGGLYLRFLCSLLCLLLICTGCAQQQQTKSKPQAQSTAQDPECNPTPIRFFQGEQQAENLAEHINGIDQAVAVHIDNELNVALKVTHFDRLRLKSLRKQVQQKLKTYFTNDHIHVTTDTKLFDELEKLNKKAWSNENQKACKQMKKLKNIEKQMRG